MDLLFRPATPRDLSPLADWVFNSAASRLAWTFDPGRNDEDGNNLALWYIHRAFQSRHGFYSYKHHMAVLLRDTPVATFSTYFYNRLLWHSALEAFKAARILGAGPAAKTVFRRMSIGFSPFPELCGGVFFDNFYVSEVHRRLSIGRRILEWMSIKCIESGIDSFGCDVEASNMAAIDLYKKGGGSIVRTVNPRRWVPVNAAHQIIFNAR